MTIVIEPMLVTWLAQSLGSQDVNDSMCGMVTAGYSIAQ